MLTCNSGIPISCLVDLILPVMQYGCRRGDEKKVPLEFWCTLSLEFLFASLILIFLFEPCACCGMKLAWARDQTGYDCLTRCGQVWKKKNEVVLCVCVCASVCVCVCVNQRHQRKQMQSLSVLGFLIEACSRLLRLHFIAVFGKSIWADCIKCVMLNIKNNVINCALSLVSVWIKPCVPLLRGLRSNSLNACYPEMKIFFFFALTDMSNHFRITNHYSIKNLFHILI